jgi:hypothetical protein
MQLAELSTNSPLHAHVGNAPALTYLASVHQLATEKARDEAKQYQETVIDYAIEWLQIVTTRVDEGLEKSNVLYRELNHYKNKIDLLRKKVNAVEAKGKESSSKLSQKLNRNEAKVKNAWKLHEASASTLCNLLEEITKGGWKDLYPLILAALQWEIGVTAGEEDANGLLSQVEKDMRSIFDEPASVLVCVGEQDANDPSDGSASSANTSTAEEDGDSDDTPDALELNMASSDDSDDSVETPPAYNIAQYIHAVV